MSDDDWSPAPYREEPLCGRCGDRGHVGPHRWRCPECNPSRWARFWRRVHLPRIRLGLDDDDLPF